MLLFGPKVVIGVKTSVPEIFFGGIRTLLVHKVPNCNRKALLDIGLIALVVLA